MGIEKNSLWFKAISKVVEWSHTATVTIGAQEALRFNELLKELGYPQETVVIYEDNEACINLSKNPQEYKRTRHIQVKYHFIRSLVQQNKIKLEYCNTKKQLADIFTKGTNGPRLKLICSQLGLIDNIKSRRELRFKDWLFSIVDRCVAVDIVRLLAFWIICDVVRSTRTLWEYISCFTLYIHKILREVWLKQCHPRLRI